MESVSSIFFEMSKNEEIISDPLGIFKIIIGNYPDKRFPEFSANLFISDLGKCVKCCKYHKYTDSFKIYMSKRL